MQPKPWSASAAVVMWSTRQRCPSSPQSPRSRRGPDPRARPASASDARAPGETAVRCTTPLHKTHGTAIGGETTVFYTWHPWFGRAIRLHEVIERTAGASARCSLVEASAVRVQELPVWMLDAPICRSMHSSTEPTASLGALTALACLLREAIQRRATDGSPDGRVASPEPHGERRATYDLSSASKAASTVKPALGGNADASERSPPMEQPPGSDPASTELSPDTLARGPRGQRRSAVGRAPGGRRR